MFYPGSLEIIVLISAYLLGSIPFGFIFAKLAGIKDLTQFGSGNIGATNVARVVGKRVASFTLFMDMFKGYLPVIIAKYAGFHIEVVSYVALVAILGHIFSLFMKFKGGKGVATAIGAYFALDPMIGVFIITIWVIVFCVYYYSSVSSLLSFVLTPIFIYYYSDKQFFYLSFVIASLIIFKHHSNIIRLFKGTEKKFKIRADVKR